MIITSKLYNILKHEDEKIEVQLADENHQIFQAHFPENPILPGFCHIEILTEILSDDISKIVLLKLKKKSLPNERISYVITNIESKRKIKILGEENTLIGNITYEYNNNNSNI